MESQGSGNRQTGEGTDRKGAGKRICPVTVRSVNKGKMCEEDVTSKIYEATPPAVLPDSDDDEVILVGYDRQTPPGAVELSDAVDVFHDAFDSVVGTVFTLEVVDPDSVSNLYFHDSSDLMVKLLAGTTAVSIHLLYALPACQHSSPSSLSKESHLQYEERRELLQRSRRTAESIA